MTKCVFRALALAAMLAMAACALAQDDPYQALRSYDGQNRKAQITIQKAIQQAGQNPAAVAPIEAGLIGVISDPASTLAGKQDACRFLWIVGTKKCVPALARLLANAETADMARYALTRNPDPSASAALRAALAKASGDAKVGIVNALGARGDAGAVATLKGLAAGSDPVAAESAIAALGRADSEGAIAALKSLPVSSVLAGNALVRAADRLAAAGSKAKAEALYLSIANSKRPGIPRASALVGLAKLQSAAGTKAAISCLSTRDEYLAVVAARIAGSTASAAGLPAINRFQTYAAPVKIALLAAWADRHAGAATGMALAALKVEDAGVRRAAIKSAGRIAGAQAVAPLAQIAAKGEGGDRDAATWALAAMPSKDADKDLFNLAKTAAPEIRATVMAVLGERPTPAARKALFEAANGADAGVAQAALRALGQVAAAGDYDALVKLLVGSSDEGVRDAAREAVVATARLLDNDAAAAGPILDALNGASMEGRASAMPALAEIGGDAPLAALKKAAGSDNADVKRAAIGALAESWSDAKAMPTLIEIAKGDQDKGTRIQALRGYIRLAGSVDGPRPTERLDWVKTALAAAERPDEKRQALGALRRCRVAEAIPVAAALLDDADLFDDAAAAIVELASRRDNRPGITGPATDAALDKIIANAKDEKLREDARKARGQ